MTAATTRRGTLATMAAVPIAGITGGVSIPASAAASPDAEFFTLYAEFKRAEDEYTVAVKQFGVAETAVFHDRPRGIADDYDLPRLEEAMNAACNREDALLRRLAAHPVTSLEGVRAKVALVIDTMDGSAWPVDESGVATALAAIDGLIAGGAS